MYHAYVIVFLFSLTLHESLSDNLPHVSESKKLLAKSYDRVEVLHLARQEIHHPSGVIYKPVSDSKYNQMTHGEAGDLEFNDNLEEINDIHVSLPPSEAGTYSGDHHANKSVTRGANEIHISREKRQVRLSAINGGNKWPQNIVPYFIDLNTYPSYYHWRIEPAVTKGLAYLESISCVKFIHRDKLSQSIKDRIRHNHSVRVFNGRSCYSHSGCSNCKSGSTEQTTQDVSISTSCLNEEYVQHEFGHVLGMTHEHTRTDMHKHIAVNYSRVSKPEAYYRKTHPEFINNAPYDLSSFQHYQSSSLVTFNPDDMWLKHGIGKPTHYDEWSLNKAYCSDRCTHLKCKNDGYITNRNGACECVCPEGLGGTTCEVILSVDEHKCGGVIYLSSQNQTKIITTPGYPGNYASNINCTFLVQAPDGYVIETNILDLDLPSSWRGCTHHISVRDRLIAQVAKEKCGKCTQKCLHSTSISNQVLILFDADHESTTTGRGARIQVRIKDGCGRCRGAPCFNGRCVPKYGNMKCSFEQGLLGDCSDVRIHDAYQKSYDDISWTEAAWEISETVPVIPGLPARIGSASGRYHIQSRRPPPLTPGPYEGAFRTIPSILYPGHQRCLRFKLFICCDRQMTLRVHKSINGVLDLTPLLTLTEISTRWEPISLTVSSSTGAREAESIEMVFIASHRVSSLQSQGHLGIDDLEWNIGRC